MLSSGRCRSSCAVKSTASSSIGCRAPCCRKRCGSSEKAMCRRRIWTRPFAPALACAGRSWDRSPRSSSTRGWPTIAPDTAASTQTGRGAPARCMGRGQRGEGRRGAQHGRQSDRRARWRDRRLMALAAHKRDQSGRREEQREDIAKSYHLRRDRLDPRRRCRRTYRSPREIADAAVGALSRRGDRHLTADPVDGHQPDRLPRVRRRHRAAVRRRQFHDGRRRR